MKVESGVRGEERRVGFQPTALAFLFFYLTVAGLDTVGRFQAEEVAKGWTEVCQS